MGALLRFHSNSCWENLAFPSQGLKVIKQEMGTGIITFRVASYLKKVWEIFTGLDHNSSTLPHLKYIVLKARNKTP
jgi:hypothetical protein